AEREDLRDAEIDPVDRISDERIARHDRSVCAETAPGGRTDAAAVAARRDGPACARPEEIEAAHQEGLRQFENPVEDGAMPLVGGRQPVFAPEVRSHRE